MLVFKTDDGEIYLNKDKIPVIDKTDYSEGILEQEQLIKTNEEIYKDLYTKQQAQYKYLTELKEELSSLRNKHGLLIRKEAEEVQMSKLKVLSKLGYKHVVMPDVFLVNDEFKLSPDILQVNNWHRDIVGEVHDKVIVYKRNPTFTSEMYKREAKGWVKGRELKWIAGIKAGYYYQVYLDENKIRLGKPGDPMKYDDIKRALEGLFYIDRTLNYKETKQLILTEMTKQLLKGK